MMARFRNFYNLKKSQDKGAVRFKQVQRFIWTKKIFLGFKAHFKQTTNFRAEPPRIGHYREYPTPLHPGEGGT